MVRKACSAAAILLLVMAGGAARAAEDGGLIQVRIERLHVASVSSDRVVLSARCAIISSVAARLGGVSFRDMRLDGWLPVFIASQQSSVSLEPDTVTELAPLEVIVYLADVPSVARLKAMLDARSIRVEGEAAAKLHLSFVGRLGLHDMHPVAMAILDQPAEMAPEAESSSLAAGLDVLSLAEHATRLVEAISPVEIVRVTDSRLLAAGVVLRTRYRLAGGGAPETIEVTRLGVRLGAHLVAAPDESLEPWAYSPQIARKIARHEAYVDMASVELSAKPMSGGDEERWNLRDGNLTVLRHGKGDEEKFVVGAHGEEISLLDRSSAGNYALLAVTEAGRTPAILPSAATAAGDDCAVLHPDENGGMDVENVGLDADGKLTRPLPEGYFGSPVISDGSVLGMVVAEGTVLPVDRMAAPDDFRHADHP